MVVLSTFQYGSIKETLGVVLSNETVTREVTLGHQSIDGVTIVMVNSTRRTRTYHLQIIVSSCVFSSMNTKWSIPLVQREECTK